MKVRPPELESDAIPKPEIRVNTLRLTLRNSLENLTLDSFLTHQAKDDPLWREKKKVPPLRLHPPVCTLTACVFVAVPVRCFSKFF